MISEGQIVIFTFPQTGLASGKLRPALVLRALPGAFNDWLICMISTSLHQEVPGLDEVIDRTDMDFAKSGLKDSSLVRVSRLAVVSANLLRGTIGNLSIDRLNRIRSRLAEWIERDIS